jgi:ubiquinone/menaquinone biosynthesis C-methylase UbiE
MSGQRERSSPEEVFSKRADFYVDSPAHTDQQVLARMVQLASPTKSMRALDVGTGTGHTAMAIAPYVEQVMALDLTEEMLGHARRLCAEREIANITFLLGDAMDMPFPDCHFDIVTCRRAAHHFIDIGAAIDEMVRVLRPGGRLVVDDRSIPDDDEADLAMNHLDFLHDPSHVREYRSAEWRATLEMAGLEVKCIEPYRRHRPLSSLTEGAGAQAEEIVSFVEALPDGCKDALGIELVSGNWYIDHFFVMVMAIKA